jgi:hypothetical protein
MFPNKAKGLGCTGGKRGRSMVGLGVLVVGAKFFGLGGNEVKVWSGTTAGDVVTDGNIVVGVRDGAAVDDVVTVY